MSSYLCLSVTFLTPLFHGRQDDGEPEWPPSPLRLFQALVASAAARDGGRLLDSTLAALSWLESQPPPFIVAPAGEPAGGYRLAVPNNALDIVARAWCRGNLSGQGDANPATHRAMKTVRPIRLISGDVVSYLWEVPPEPSSVVREHVEFLTGAMGQLVALGWGVDLVAGNGQLLSSPQADELPGERWRERGAPGAGLRVPIEGTLAALVSRHQKFLDRVQGDGLIPVPTLMAFREVPYRRDTDPANRPWAMFQLLTPDGERFQAFNPRRGMVVAGMVRHAVAQAARAAGRPEPWIVEFVLGHGPSGRARGAADLPRFAYLPLPTLGPHGIGCIQRVLIAEPPGGTGEQVSWLRRVLPGHELTGQQTQQSEAILSLAPSDRVVSRYVGAKAGNTAWSTTTPVVLPGHDDAELDKAERLLRKAIEHAGFPPLLAQHAQLEWRRAGFRPRLDLATRFDPPAYLKGYPRYHVRVHWRDAAGRPVPVRGPLVIGAGRYCGLGLFAVEPSW